MKKYFWVVGRSWATRKRCVLINTIYKEVLYYEHLSTTIH